MAELADYISALLGSYGYIGVFAGSLLGSIIPFVSAPYLLPIILGIVAGGFDPLITTIVSAAGATLGKMLLFRGFQAGRAALSAETKIRMKPLEVLLLKYGWIAVLIAAATPLPDDIIFLPMALANYDFTHFALAVFVGKLLITGAISYFSLYFKGVSCYLINCTAGRRFSGGLLFAAFLLAIIAIFAAYLITRLDWEKMLGGWARVHEKK